MSCLSKHKCASSTFLPTKFTAVSAPTTQHLQKQPRTRPTVPTQLPKLVATTSPALISTPTASRQLSPTVRTITAPITSQKSSFHYCAPIRSWDNRCQYAATVKTCEIGSTCSTTAAL